MFAQKAWIHLARMAPAFPAIFVFIALIIAELALIRRKKTDYDNGSPSPCSFSWASPLGRRCWCCTSPPPR